jgi:hypothetical protein
MRTACKADSFTALCEPIVQKIIEPRRLTTLWASTACYRFAALPLTASTVLVELTQLKVEAEMEVRIMNFVQELNYP